MGSVDRCGGKTRSWGGWRWCGHGLVVMSWWLVVGMVTTVVVVDRVSISVEGRVRSLKKSAQFWRSSVISLLGMLIFYILHNIFIMFYIFYSGGCAFSLIIFYGSNRFEGGEWSRLCKHSGDTNTHTRWLLLFLKFSAKSLKMASIMGKEGERKNRNFEWLGLLVSSNHVLTNLNNDLKCT
mgnify:CR=1 FL=1